jgi:hypothetical protein
MMTHNAGIRRAWLAPALLLSLAACGPGGRDDSAPPPTPDEPPPAQRELELAGEQPLPLRGYVAINALLKQRLVEDPAFELLSYLEPPSQPQGLDRATSLADLMGGHQLVGSTMSTKDAVPAPMNMLLWYMALDGFAADVGGWCADDGAEHVALRADVRDVTLALCDPAADPAVAADLWSMALREDATDADHELWTAFVTEGAPVDDPVQRVRQLVLAALWNQDFLAGK